MIEGKSNSTGYRERIYDEYGKRFQDAKKTFDVEASKRWARSCSYYLRGWLPHAPLQGISKRGGR